MTVLSQMEGIKSSTRSIKANNDDGSGSEKEAQPGLFDNGVNSALVKKCLEAFMRNIDRIDKSNKEYYKEMLTKMVCQDIRDDEIRKI